MILPAWRNSSSRNSSRPDVSLVLKLQGLKASTNRPACGDRGPDLPNRTQQAAPGKFSQIKDPPFLASARSWFVYWPSPVLSPNFLVVRPDRARGLTRKDARRIVRVSEEGWAWARWFPAMNSTYTSPPTPGLKLRRE